MSDVPSAAAAGGATAACVNHPDRPAIEHCERCGRALCGECLWYSATGERLCQTHAARAMAAGQAVQPPEMYADAVELRGPGPAVAVAGAGGARHAPYRGNSTDVLALLAATLGLVTLVVCGTGNQALYCLPFVALLLGIIGLTSARDAVDPARTRLLAWIGLGSGGVFLVLGVLFALLMMLCFFLPFLSVAISGGGAFTPVPRLTPGP